MTGYTEVKYICDCLKLTDDEVKLAIKENHLKSMDDVTEHFQAGWACGECFKNIRKAIEER